MTLGIISTVIVRANLAFIIALASQCCAFADDRGKLCIVRDPSGNKLPVRDSPRGVKISEIDNGTKVIYKQITNDDRDLPWARINSPLNGWVYGNFLANCTVINGSISNNAINAAPTKSDRAASSENAARFLHNNQHMGTFRVSGCNAVMEQSGNGTTYKFSLSHIDTSTVRHSDFTTDTFDSVVFSCDYSKPKCIASGAGSNISSLEEQVYMFVTEGYRARASKAFLYLAKVCNAPNSSKYQVGEPF